MQWKSSRLLRALVRFLTVQRNFFSLSCNSVTLSESNLSRSGERDETNYELQVVKSVHGTGPNTVYMSEKIYRKATQFLDLLKRHDCEIWHFSWLIFVLKKRNPTFTDTQALENQELGLFGLKPALKTWWVNAERITLSQKRFPLSSLTLSQRNDMILWYWIT